MAPGNKAQLGSARWLTVMFGVLSLCDQAGTAALAIHLFNHGGTRELSLLAVRFFPPALAGFAVPAVLARAGIGRTLRTVPAARAALIVVCGAAALAGASVQVLVLLLGLDMAVAQVFRPALATALPRLSHSVEGVARASAALANAKSVGGFAGATVGAALCAVTGLGPTCLLMAVVILAVLPGVFASTATAPFRGRPRVQSLLGSLPAVRTRAAVVPLLMGSMRTLLRGVWSGVVVILAIRTLGLGSRGVSLLACAAGLGGLLSLAITRHLLAGSRLAPWMCLSITVAAAATQCVATFPVVWLSLLAMFIWGLALALADLSASTVIPRVVDHRNAAAVSAINENLKLILEGVGAFGTPVLAQLLGARLALAVGAEMVLVVMAIGWPLAHRAERAIAERMSTLALLQSVPLLRRLPLDAIETLAAGARSVSCAEGQQMIVAGEYGDTYWVLRSGSALVLAPGMEPKRLGPGSGFGEVGLLHAIPRTATVVAAEDAEALVIDRDSFLLALTGLATVPDPMPEPMPEPNVPPGDAEVLILAAPTVASLGERRAAEVARRAGRLWFAPGSVVFQAGDPADCCYVVLSGAVRVDAPGRMTTLGVGREFGSIGLRITGSRTATVTAVEATELAVLTARELDPAGPETSAATAVPA